MSNTHLNPDYSIFAEFTKRFELWDLQGCPQVEALACTYYVQTQSLKIAKGDSSVILDTRIMLLEKPQYTSVSLIVGYVRKSDTVQVNNDAPFLMSLEFVDKVKDSAVYYSDKGYEFAKRLLETLTPEEIKTAVINFKGQGKQTRPHILMMCAFDLLRKQTLYLYETEAIELFEPPKYYNWDGVLYEFSRQKDDSESVFALYYPAGSISHV